MKSTLTLLCNGCKNPIGYIDTDILSEFGSAISKACIYGKTSTIYCSECWTKETRRSEEE